MRVREDLRYHELIGLRVVVHSHERSLEGVEGTVIDETRNMLSILSSRGRRVMLQKNGSVFDFSIANQGDARVDGKEIVGRPEDRISRVR